MRIAQVVRSLEQGGLERLAIDLAIAQKNRGHHVVVYVVYKHEPALLRELEGTGIRVVQFDKEVGFSLRTLCSMAMQLRRDRVSVVHTHNELVHTYGSIAARLAGIPCVLNTIHGTKSSQRSRKYKALLPLTDTIVAVSDETAAQFSSERSRNCDKFRVVRNGIPVAKFTAKSAQPGSQWPRIRIGTVARLVEIKDQATLLKAFHIVRKYYSQAELHFLGDGPLRQKLELLATELDLGSSVTFHGASANVAGFLSGLDLFALSSLSEGLPIAILEAMSAGLPIVSTKVGGISEVAPEHTVAVYCPPANPEALAHAIRSMLEPRRMRTMGLAGQQIARDSFSIEAMSEGYESLYLESLAKNCSGYSSWLQSRREEY